MSETLIMFTQSDFFLPALATPSRKFTLAKEIKFEIETFVLISNNKYYKSSIQLIMLTMEVCENEMFDL